jgi:hypothetical protein
MAQGGGRAGSRPLCAVPLPSDRPVRKVTVTDERSAALLLRVWLEDGTDEFRARVTAVRLESPGEDRTIAVATSPSQVLDAVSHWLDEFVRTGTATD